MADPVFRRILLKLSGEALLGSRGFGVDAEVVHRIAQEVHDVHQLGVQVAIVVGGGNFIRGVAASAQGLDRVVADHMGMLATVINALALQDALEKRGSPTRVVTAIEMREVAEPFIRRRVIRHIEKGRVVVLAAGTGNPYFSTDTAAASSAAEEEQDSAPTPVRGGTSGSGGTTRGTDNTGSDFSIDSKVVQPGASKPPAKKLR